MIAEGLLIAGATAAAASDVSRRKVGNQLNLAILFGGLGWRAVSGNPDTVLLGLAGVAVGFAMLFGMFAVRWIGAGDVKLLAALGAWLGPTGVLYAGLLGLAGGGVLAVGLAIAGGGALRRQVAGNIKAAALTLTAPVAPRREQRLVVPMAVPLAVAAVGVFLLRGF
jgi:prepilin peptidase CpaA